MILFIVSMQVFSPKKSGDEKQEEDSDADGEMDDGGWWLHYFF